MKNKILAIIFLITLCPVRSDEGMWLPMLIDRLNIDDMKKVGLNLTAEEIYSINRLYQMVAIPPICL